MTINSLNFDAQELREKILDLAMRGKLVKQDPNDEPASVLLKKIAQEKKQLIKEKKVKKTKPLPEITDEEKPFNIPDSWEWVRLGDISEVILGQAPKGTTVHTQSVGVEFHQGKTEFTNEIIGKSNKFTTQDNKIVDQSYILMAVRAPVGDVNLLDRSIFIGRGLAGIKGYSINKKYLFYYLNTKKSYYNKLSTGSTFKAINGTIIQNTPIALPPLEEQSRIADKIAQLFTLLRKVESSTKQYVELQQLLKNKVLDLAMQGKLVEQRDDEEPASVLLEKIRTEKAELIKEKKIKKTKPLPEITDEEKPFDIPDSWEWVRLGDVANWAAGATPSRKKQEYYLDGTIPWLKTGDLNDAVINTTSEFITELGAQNSSVKLNKPGNILIAMYGATIGKLGIVGKKALTTNQACLGGEPYIGVYNWYLFYYLLASRKSLIKLGAGGAQPNISKQKVENYIFSLPPLNEQKRIVVKVEELLSLISNK